jgi:hypothetical protein
MTDATLADLIVKYALPADMEGIRLEEMRGYDLVRDQIVEGRRLQELRLRELVEAEEWNDVFMLLGHHARACALVLLAPSLGRDDLALILREWWNMMEGVRPRDAIDLFRRAGFVTDSRQHLPKGTLTIYRGVPMSRRRLGLSWTLNLETARFFAARGRSEPGPTYAAEVDSADVLAYFTTRNEAEVIVDPTTLLNVRRMGS